MSQSPEQPIECYLKLSRSDLSDYWLDAYGWISCYFAQLEGLSYALIEALAANENRTRLSKLPYQSRVDEAGRLVCTHLRARGDDKLAEEWSRFLAEAKLTAPMRNKILHNPLTVSLVLGDPLHDVNAGIILTQESGRPVLKLGAVQAFAKTMHNLNLRMQNLLARSRLSL